MSLNNVNNLYPRVALTSAGKTGTVSQALAISGVVTGAFSSFQSTTNLVFFDVQTADVICTIDGTSAALLTAGHRLQAGTNYTWNASVAKGAKFVSTGTSSFIFLTELAI